MVEHKHRGTGKPLSVELAPYGLAPSSVGHHQVKRTFVQVVPENARRQVSHGIEIVVGHHLRLSRGAAGEIHQHGVAVGVHKGGALEFRGLLPFLLPVVPAAGNLGLVFRQAVADGHEFLHRRTFGHGGLHLTHHVVVVNADNGLDAGPGVSVNNVVLGQHVGGRNHHRTNLMQGQHYHPPFVAPLQDEHHGVVLADADALQVRGGLVGLLFQLTETCAYLFAFVVGPEQCQLVGVCLGPFIHHVVGKIEILRDDEFQVLVVILHRGKCGLLQESLQQTVPLPKGSVNCVCFIIFHFS